MAFGGEIHHGADGLALEFGADQRAILYAALDETVAPVVSQITDVVRIAGVGELVEIDDLFVATASSSPG